MVKIDLQPPLAGPGNNPVLYGVAHGLARLFPPVEAPPPAPRGPDAQGPAPERDARERG